MIFVNFVEVRTGDVIGFSMRSIGGEKPEVECHQHVFDVNGNEYEIVSVEQAPINNIIYIDAYVAAI